MNYNITLLAIVEIFSAISIGIFILAITYKIMVGVGKKYYDIQDFNLSYSIFTASVIIGVGIMISGIINPLISSFRLLTDEGVNLIITLKYIGIGAIYISIAYMAAVFIGLLSTYLYSKLTPINEFEEIKNNNVGVALIVSSILIALILLSKDGVSLLIESVVPYPDVPPF